MKVLFHHLMPFWLAHGGLQIQIVQTRMALQKLGLEVEFLRWWDDQQRGDVLHFFGRMPTHVLKSAQEKGIKVVISDLLTGHGSRSPLRHWSHKSLIRLIEKTFPRSLTMSFYWDSYRLANACVALTPLEANLMKELFRAGADRLHVVPNGVEEVFLESRPAPRGQWLVCTATITPRKRVLELAQTAVKAKTPLWIIGKPYSETESYTKKFLALVKQHSQLVRFEGAINDRVTLARIYRGARGFVLFSDMESLSLSALEAAACECPLLLSDLPWARTYFKQNAIYCPIGSPSATAQHLRHFYDAAPGLKPPPKPPTWLDVARELKAIYESLLNAPHKP